MVGITGAIVAHVIEIFCAIVEETSCFANFIKIIINAIK
jgi:hypothetical protein